MVAGGILSQDQIADVLDMVQTAQAGNLELDARIDCALAGRIFVCMGTECRYYWRSAGPDCATGDAKPAARWSQDVMASLRMIPSSHNYSVGRRDGVCWAWIQPNDAWDPAETEYRHDHPQGSGLLVAYTMSLALMSAAMILIQRLRASEQTKEQPTA
jgi:hypothetical protein